MNKLEKAIEIFKKECAGAKGKFRAYPSETNSNEVDIMCETGLYCSINVRTGKVKEI